MVLDGVVSFAERHRQQAEVPSRRTVERIGPDDDALPEAELRGQPAREGDRRIPMADHLRRLGEQGQAEPPGEADPQPVWLIQHRFEEAGRPAAVATFGQYPDPSDGSSKDRPAAVGEAPVDILAVLDVPAELALRDIHPVQHAGHQVEVAEALHLPRRHFGQGDRLGVVPVERGRACGVDCAQRQMDR